ncbi:hypothetical protein HPB47_017045 [Ixodes persulcatus]|uniref:Uncharacterized protein n=1 Tax=Ixodes persulcatus TaxID=34615 RepID=A0AC60QRR1_IXOPE|nr:hypothetical protein HPB47_017045 [Ixodes persulcatus]
MTALEELRLHQLTIPDEGIKSFVEMLKQQPLASVELVGNELNIDAGERIVKALCKDGNQLRVFKYIGNSFNSGATNYLCKMLDSETCVLEELALHYIPNFVGAQQMDIAKCITNNLTLRVLELYECPLTKSSCPTLMKALALNKTISTLRLTACNIGPTAPYAFAELIRVNDVLEDVDVMCNHLQFNSAVQLARSLCVNKKLRRLALNANDFKSNSNVVLVESLSTNKTLQEMLLGYVKMTDQLYRAIHASRAYHRVRLHYDSLGARNMINCINVQLPYISSIHLDSIENNFDSDCLSDLLESLCMACNLKTLYVRVQTSMTDTASRHLAKMLIRSRCLKKISVVTRTAHECHMIRVVNGLSRNESVTHFQMYYRATSKCTTDALVEMFRRNRTLVHFGTLISTEKELKQIATGLIKNCVLKSMRFWNENYSDA